MSVSVNWPHVKVNLTHQVSFSQQTGKRTQTSGSCFRAGPDMGGNKQRRDVKSRDSDIGECKVYRLNGCDCCCTHFEARAQRLVAGPACHRPPSGFLSTATSVAGTLGWFLLRVVCRVARRTTSLCSSCGAWSLGMGVMGAIYSCFVLKPVLNFADTFIAYRSVI